MSGALRDEVFPGLAAALDPESMRLHLDDALPECREDLHVEEVRVFNVLYSPGQSCTILYQVKFRRRDTGRSATQLLAGRLLTDGRMPREPDAESLQAYRRLEGLALRSPVVRIPRLRLAAYAHPYDPELPGLLEACDPSQMRRQLSRLWKRRGLRVRRIAVDSLGYTPGARAALRYEILSEDRDTRIPEVRRLVGKIDSQRDAAELFARGWALWRAAALRIRLAGPVGYLPGVNLWLQERVEGARLADLAGETSLIRPLRQTAGYLAVLHELSLPLRSRQAALHHVRAVRRWGSMIAALRTGEASRIRRLCDRLVTQLEQRARITGPVHGDLHPANILVDGPRVNLIDLDNMSLGDRLMDVGRFLSALRVSSLRAFGTVDGLAEAGESFLECYLSRSGEDERRARLFEAASLIISAGTGFRLQRPGWEATAGLLIDEAERTLQRAGDASRSDVAVNARPMPRRTGTDHDWSLDDRYVAASLDSAVRRRYGGDIVRCVCVRRSSDSRRARLRYELTLALGDRRRRIDLDGIRWHDQRGGRVTRRLEALREALAERPDAPRLPRPVAYLRDAGIQVLAAPQGTPFAVCLDGDDGPAAVQALALALQALWDTAPPGIRQRPPEAELRALTTRVKAVSEGSPRQQAQRLLEYLAPLLQGTPEATCPSLGHLSPRKLLWIAPHVGLTEIDDVTLAHPLTDGADFLARLTREGLERGDAEPLDGLAEVFRRSLLSGWSGRARLAVYEAAALLRHGCIAATRDPASTLGAELLSRAGQQLDLAMEKAE